MTDQKEWVDDAITGLGADDKEDDVSRRSSKTNKRTAAASSKGIKSSPSRKRPRSKPTSAHSKRPQKPKPPPAPPASLVSLMKKDKSVLQFFASLQENVTYDVDKWKHEAAHWKRMATSLPSSASKQNGSRTKATKSTNNKVQRRSMTNYDETKPGMLGGMNDDEEGSTIPITDEALFGEYSDDDDDDDDKNNNNSNDQINECSERATHFTSAVEESQHDSQTLQLNNSRRSLILENLIEAKRLLHLLGVSLVVVVESKPNEILLQTNVNKECETRLHSATNNDENDVESEHTTSFLKEDGPISKTTDNEMPSTIAMERIFHRQSDEKVVADMMASLRTLIEASSSMDNHKDESEQQNYHPFHRCGKFHCPNVYFGRHEDDKDQTVSMWQHPASVGLKYLIDALTIMDVYCHDSFEESDWELIFEDGSNQDMFPVEDMTILKIGMRNRCQLVEMLLSSLHVEITRTWANAERALNLDSSAMHFHPTDVVNEGGALDSEEEFAYSVKNFNRLVSLEERIAHGRIASLLHRRMGAFQKAAELVVGYVVSAAPSRGVEHYHPKIPPALSMCVLESLLSPEDHDPAKAKSERNDEWFRECIDYILSSSGDRMPAEASSLLLKAIAFVTRTAADIWKVRCSSSDKRIRDIALVETAAYKRLLRLSKGWLNMVGSEEDELLKISGIFSLCDVSKVSKFFIEKKVSPTELGLSCTAFLITTGNADDIIRFCGNVVSSLKKRVFIDNTPSRSRQLFSLLPACCFAYNSIMSRKWEFIKLASSVSGRHTAAAFSIKHEFSSILAAAADVVFGLEESETDWAHMNVVVIQCYKLLGDALGLYRFAKRILSSLNAVEEYSSLVASHRPGIYRIISSLLDAAAITTVRVINLERRRDRLLDFMECAVCSERMLVMKGVANLKRKSSVSICKKAASICGNEQASTGNFAYDGKCSQDELERKIAQSMEGNCALSDFIQEKWKPSELSAFDKHAGSDFKDAYTTTSEKACALSHIATWFGVESSLSSFDFRKGLDNNSTAVNLNKIAGMLTISGFARGPPLLNENEAMDPSPACIILEDDAILCDRFNERIEAVLDELPRDFHFCSIGYSRPKFAPIIDYSPEIGIPSCLWYLTGYILSSAGARFLISSLPVVGPVDSWIAVKMRDNFANRFGDSLGVGKHAKTHRIPLPKDLSKIMKFRAFAAHAPLCTQKQVVAQSKAIGTRGGGQGNWCAAKKDSDVEYSGY